MKKYGKVLFFNATEGSGIIITSQKEKLQFNVMEWDDFEIMPALGLEVVFDYIDETAKNIAAKQDDDIEEEGTTQLETATVPEETSQIETEPQPTKNISETSEETIQETAEDEVDETPEENIQETSQDKLNDETPIKPENDTLQVEEKHSTDNEDAVENDDQEQDVQEENTEEPDPKHFEDDEDIELLNDLEEEYGPREESVTLTLNIKIAVENYFNIINNHIINRHSYKKIKGKLNYLLIRRFLWTTYNNLSEIDIHIITPQIKMLSDDLKLTSRLYDDFIRKTRYPALAYQEVFLACQDEYMKITKGAHDMMEKLSRLRSSEEQIGTILKVKKQELSDNIQTEEFDLLQDELKSLNGAYVDIVHMMAEIDERYKHDMQLLQTFEQEYKEEFSDMFSVAAKQHHIDLLELLNVQAFLLDDQLWKQAKSSKAIKAHFQQSNIEGELNTKTYLKYYLDSLDDNKTSEDNQQLVKLYNYLVSLHKDQVMIVSSSAQDAMEYESELKKLGSAYEVKAFIDEKSALKWAMKHTIKVLIIEDELSRLNAEIFLKYYKKYILVSPKIILLGIKPHNIDYPISKLLSKNVSPKVLLQQVKELFKSKH
ncbi:hypothetical protein [Sulfurimonas microaerophilic]|uniref:hypothetical protein n=1 Tax=Sulfurimonas microaerophilic TaxID=3058392 RepID=UPI00271540EA|nr:hypothetical protein [Sulfurimonas sp. hsl 1-7]